MEKTAPLLRIPTVHRVLLSVVCVCFVLSSVGYGQGAQDRYQLGRRLERFERAWQQASQEYRAKSTGSMEQAVQSFFSLQLSRAGKMLDQAWLQVRGLESEQQAKGLREIRWKLDFQTTLLDTSQPVLQGRAGVFYDQEVESSSKEEVVLKVWPWNDSPTKVMELDRGQSPLMSKTLLISSEEDFQVDLQGLREGDYVLTGHLVGSQPGELDWICPSISLVDRLPERLAALEAWTEANRKDSTRRQAGKDGVAGLVESAKSTARFLAREIVRGRKGTSFEIDLPWNKLIRDFEQIVGVGVDPPAGQAVSLEDSLTRWMHQPGWKWMQLSQGRSTQVVRIQVPELKAGETDKRFPVLIALHGAGGSENMFFQTYGAGRLVELGDQRGWIVVSPRQTMTGLSLDVPEMVQALSECLPVDKERVMLVGHSMGAAQAMTQVSKHPESVRMVAALGGGGGVSDTEAIRKVPFYVAAGDRDFGKPRAKSLSQQLKRLGCPVEYREYKDVEHMVIVQAALDDVFAFFDRGIP